MVDLPQAESADPDGVQVALRAAQALWSRGDTSESLRWLRRAAESASDEGADIRSLQLAKAAAELRAKLFGSAESAPALASEASGVHLAASEAASAGAVTPAQAVGAAAPAGDAGLPSEEAHPSSRPPSTATQYVVHRPREAPRQLMGLSSTTLETAVQRDSASYATVPSWSADAERRVSSAPPPLPRAVVDEYEELEAEPDDDEPASDPAWASPPAPTWRGRDVAAAGADGDSNAEAGLAAAALAGPSNPPPLPGPLAFDDDDEGDEDELRAEQPTVVIPPIEERARSSDSRRPPAPPREEVLASDSLRDMPGSWEMEAGGFPSWNGGEGWMQSGASSESSPAKLTARVHHQAVRVSFAPDSRAPGQYVLRVLREGEKPAAGERVALLVALEPGTPLV